jgi:hypothetical protein
VRRSFAEGTEHELAAQEFKRRTGRDFGTSLLSMLQSSVMIGQLHRHNGSGSWKSFWQTTFVGDSHCGAGRTVGDFAGEWLVFLTGLTVAGSVLWADYVIDFPA